MPTPATPATRPNGRSSFVVVANRLPVDRIEMPDGSTAWRRSPGGLVTALAPVMQRHHGAWIGWTGSPDEKLDPFDDNGMHLVPVMLSAEDVQLYYEGFSNATLWPLYHDVIVAPEFHREWWESYVAVNRRFAEAAAEAADDNADVWVHDYQLQLVPAMLRRLRPDVRIGFFLHIPFPPTELFAQMPWRRQILDGLMGADLVGFQRPGAASNFARLARNRMGLRTRGDRIHLPDDRIVRAKAFPISIDVNELESLARQPETTARAAEMREEVGNPEHILLGVDRLDYTKGIRQRLRAFGELLDEKRVSVDDAVFIQVATPSRERVEQYRVLRDEIELLVGRINGEHGRIGTPAINYLHTSYSRTEMAALFRAADVAVVTPLRDGMNLVAKEYVSTRYDDTGALVLSEFAGAADEFRQAFLVNPHDINGMKDTIVDAMNTDERQLGRRMKAMRKHLAAHDVNVWAQAFLKALHDEE
ncbi:alpha,alpha-trehalose-phosphate synthase (UDP-forming) [Kribbella jejuensis]|uniref:Trehalose 6-phosphate synthase n=1 Tax=Kribbella jejuensis TaxID=236068 RepID=A0A542E7N8_9ACTN|nr:trehalose-6-phosphate synthase [Kribbella jejuensis]TQJ11360.1 trehalose 6-phosphate synthase [Kribbella jejuensis]